MASELIDKPAIGGGRFRDLFRSRQARLDAYVDNGASSSSGESEVGEHDYLTKTHGEAGDEGEENEEDAIGAELDEFGGPPRRAFEFVPSSGLTDFTEEIHTGFIEAIKKYTKVKERVGFKFTYEFEALNLGVQASVNRVTREFSYWEIEDLYITGDMDMSVLISHSDYIFKPVVEAEPSTPDWQSQLYAALLVIMYLVAYTEGISTDPRAKRHPRITLKIPAVNLGDKMDALRIIPAFSEYLKTVRYSRYSAFERRQIAWQFKVDSLSPNEFQFYKHVCKVGGGGSASPDRPATGGGSASPSVLRVAATACLVTLACIFAPTWMN